MKFWVEDEFEETGGERMAKNGVTKVLFFLNRMAGNHLKGTLH